MYNLAVKTSIKFNNFIARNKMKAKEEFKNIMIDKRGSGFLDDVIKMAIAVVIGAGLLAAVYLLVIKTAMPKVGDNLTNMFDYKGN